MGLFGFGEGWLRDGLAESAKHGRALEIVQAYNALDGLGATAYGRAIGGLAGKRELLDLAARALRDAIAALPAATPDSTFVAVARVLGRAAATADGAWREPLEARRRGGSVTGREQLRTAIARADAAQDYAGLAAACVELVAGRVPDFAGVRVAWLHADDLAALRDEAMARLRAAVPKLTWQEAKLVDEERRRGGLALDLAPRFAELAAAREQARAGDGGEPREPALERQIAAAFAAAGDALDEEPFEVLADFLQQHGHPRGELIARQLRGADTHAYLAEHAAGLLGPLAAAEPHGLTWRAGFITEARLASAEVPIAALLEALLVHPSGRFVRSIAIDRGPDWPDEDATLDAMIALLATDAPASLRALHLGAFEVTSGLAWAQIGDVAPLWRLPQLESLIVQGSAFSLGAVAAPNLRALALRTVALDAPAIRAVIEARVPALASLELWFGPEDEYEEGERATLDDVRALLARTDLPALTHLGLVDASVTDELAEAVARAPLRGQLRSLDLAYGTLSDAGAALLAEHCGHLARLDIRETYVTPAGVARLRAAGIREVVATDLRPDADDYRYPSISE